MPKQNILILSILAVSLSGCTGFNSTASKLGVNFWKAGPKKAPCKSVASLETDTDVVCVGIPVEKPSDAELIELRGRYKVENGVIKAPIAAAP